MKAKKQPELDSLVGFKGEVHQGYMNREETAPRQKKRIALEVMEACRQHIGPLWRRLEKLGLNTKRDTNLDELERCKQKMSVAHESKASDADYRFKSASARLDVKFEEMQEALRRTRNGRWAGNDQKKADAQRYAVEKWDLQISAGQPLTRVGVMLKDIRASVFGGNQYRPENDTILGWLRELTKKSKYKDASKPGRPSA